MTTRIHFETEMNRASLLELRAEIDRLLQALGASAQAREVEDYGGGVDVQELADHKVAALWERLGVNSRTFLSTCAQRPAGQEFTLQELAEELDAPVSSVRSWHRNLSRSLRHVEERYPEPPLLHQRWVDSRYRYQLSPEVQLAIRQQHPLKAPGNE